MEKTEEVFLKALSCGMKGRCPEDPDLTKQEWEEVMEISQQQSLLPLVFEAVYSFLPEDLEEKYRSRTLSWVMAQVRSSDAFLKTYRALKEKGIEPLVIKGILCRETYPFPDLRISADEDILVRREEYTLLHESLKDLGFLAEDPNFRSGHEILYRLQHLKIEGHWELFPHENHLWDQMNDMTEGILERAVHVNVEGTDLLSPEPTDHMIYLLLHAMKHFVLSGVGIRQICAIVMLDRRFSVDWDRVGAVMEKLGGLSFTRAVLDAGVRYFDMKLPEGWERADSEHLIRDSLSGGVFGHSSEDRLHSASLTAADAAAGGRASLGLLQTVFPSRSVMEINYPWVAASPLLLPAGWAVRLFHYAARIGKDVSPMESIRIGKERARLLKEYGLFQE